jgi:hypothetical protein
VTAEVASRPPASPAPFPATTSAGGALAAEQPAPAAAQARPAPAFFSDLDADVSVDFGDPGQQAGSSPGVDFHTPGVYVPPPSEPGAAWPAAISTAAEAEDGLRRALRGAADGARPLHDLALRTLDTLSDLERSVLAGEPHVIDVAPVRKAAVMRLRVAEALASVPPPGTPVDSTALSAVLGEIDGLLAEVAPLLADAPPELAPALEEIRNGLVREAIDFSEAAQRVATAPAEAAARPAPVVASGRASAARVVSYDSAQEMELEKSERRRHWLALVVLGLALTSAAGYHFWDRMARSGVHPPDGVPGAPSNSLSAMGSGNVRMVVSRTGKFDEAELQRFKTEQELLGNRVEEVSPGVLRISPAGEPKK